MKITDAMNRSQAPIEFTGYTIQGDELIEWRDDEVGQHGVQINREWRGLTDISFYFGMQSEAHSLFLALCQAEDIRTDWDEAQLLVAEENAAHAPGNVAESKDG